MRRIAIATGIVIAAATTAGAARAATTTSYVNIYWERSGGSWDNDVKNGSGTQHYGYTSLLTKDELDSMLHALDASAYFTDLTAWGLGTVTTPIKSLEVTNCGDPPSTLMAAAPRGLCEACDGQDNGVALNNFLACVLAANPQLANTASQNTILNVLVPPYVGASDWASDWCAATGFWGVNTGAQGHSITFI